MISEVDHEDAFPTGSVSNVVFVDADNTMWDTNRIFADAQLYILNAVEVDLGVRASAVDRLSMIREIDQDLASQHHEAFRYPPALLIAGLALRLKGADRRSAVRQALMGSIEPISAKKSESIVEIYSYMLQKTPPLLPGVLNGLKELKSLKANLVIVTEGSKQRVQDSVIRHDLTSFFDRIIEGKKDRRLYMRVLRLLKNPNIRIMVGDQYTRDILPAHEAGLTTVHIPGSFVPEWEVHRKDDVANYRLPQFGEVPAVFTSLLRRAQSIQSDQSD